ncbi:chorismate--pyruvate lyase [Natronospira proteinivora]|uniref:Chorismate--pyruvate lyase n=1 Tax=Natronospira proteinivora TaxID=1807133 RepID=A0ABT1G9H3_9GAMM|nr:chorismate lyase [Natronospira proteinivora]MCP1727969.1 chorismate--pyruvate lyase [Natronospira proteinivora]
MSTPSRQPETQTRATWLSPDQVAESDRPRNWPWLVEAGSLTGRLEASLGAPVEVERLSEVSDGDGALRREVRLYAAGRPLIYAVSHIPAALLDRLEWVSSLGDQPLGTRLFSDATASREDLCVARLAADDPLVRRACDGLDRQPSSLWARRSRLVVGGQAMVIVECFLQGEAE